MPESGISFEREIESAAEEVFDFLNGHVAADVGDGVGERNLLGADLDTVLCEAALLYAAVASEGAKAFLFEDRSGWVIVKELDLCDGSCADEACLFIELWAYFHA